MHLAPRQGFYRNVQIISACAGYFQHRGGGESGAAVAVVLHLYMGILCFDLFNQLAKYARAAYACHILEAYLVGAVINQVLDHIHVVSHRMHRGMGYGERRLGYHSGLLGVFYA